MRPGVRLTAVLVAGWVRLYTHGLPGHVATRRSEEMASDILDHIAWERDRGTSDWRISRSILSRMLRGVFADLSWRRHTKTHRSRTGGVPMNPLPLILATAIVASALGGAAVILGEIDDAPGLMLIGLVLILGAILVSLKAGRRQRQRSQP